MKVSTQSTDHASWKLKTSKEYDNEKKNFHNSSVERMHQKAFFYQGSKGEKNQNGISP